MTATATPGTVVDDRATELKALLDLQRRAFIADGPPSAQVRRRRIDLLVAAILDNAEEFVAAMNLDFGHRPAIGSLASDVVGPLLDIAHIRRNVRWWMRSRPVRPGLLHLAGVRAWVSPSPLGVVGVIAPWNFPITLAIEPAVAALAAGNRVMIKMSELAPNTAALLQREVAARFDPSEVTVVTGDSDVAAVFSALPLDHLFFTGSPAVGKLVQRAAAENLVPVTLELGGKNPTVVHHDANLAMAARRTMAARLTNSGQLCLSSDYVFVPRAQLEEFVGLCVDAARTSFPTVAENDDYCAIVNSHHYERICGLIDDARKSGATVTSVHPRAETLPDPAARIIAPTILTGVTSAMKISSEEVFGPVLSVLPYDDLDEVIDYVNGQASPLASYWYGSGGADYRRFVARTRSGGVTRNDFALHMFVVGAPFGGVGASGPGYYHGRHGFDAFSHLRGMAAAPKRLGVMTFVSPPFSAKLHRALLTYVRFEARRTARRLRAGRPLDRDVRHRPR